MFKNVFSFKGRIRRLEFGISFAVYWVVYVIVLTLTQYTSGLFGLLFIPMIWFYFAQGTKRCHDLGRMGVCMIIPFYFLWMIFKDGEPDENAYGPNPKNPIKMDWDFEQERLHPMQEGYATAQTVELPNVGNEQQ